MEPSKLKEIIRDKNDQLERHALRSGVLWGSAPE